MFHDVCMYVDDVGRRVTPWWLGNVARSGGTTEYTTRRCWAAQGWEAVRQLVYGNRSGSTVRIGAAVSYQVF